MSTFLLPRGPSAEETALVRFAGGPQSGSDGGAPTAGHDEGPLADRFVSRPVTPREIAAAVVEDDGVFRAIRLDGVDYVPTARFMKGLAQRMRVPLRVFDLFSPLEVVRRAAERTPDLALRVTTDESEHRALGLVEDNGPPVPADAVERIMRDDPRLREFGYSEGVVEGMFDVGETWDVPQDGLYRVHVRTSVPVDGLGPPEATLAILRLACTNGVIAESSQFRTKLEVKDGSGEHFRRILRSFGNPQGVETLHGRLLAAATTKASVGEVHAVDCFLRKNVRGARDSMLLRERLQETAGNPCVRYGVTDLGAIGVRRRALLPADCSVADVLNFVTELRSHHADVLKNPGAADELVGSFHSSGFDLEDMYPSTDASPAFALDGLVLGDAKDA